jgi:hypothetical protein
MVCARDMGLGVCAREKLMEVSVVGALSSEGCMSPDKKDHLVLSQNSALHFHLEHIFTAGPVVHCNRLSGVTVYTHAFDEFGNKTTVRIPPCTP